MMKKKILIAIITLMSVTSFAQSYTNAIGLRGSFATGITFKHMMGDKAGVEFILDTRWSGFNITGLYEIHAQAFDVEGLNWYYGAGVHIGSYQANKNNSYFNDTRTVIGIDGIIGIEYNISEIPINISLDYKPAFNLVGYSGFWGDNGALSVRYYF